MSRADLERYEPRWERPAEVEWAGHRFLTRARALRRPRDARAPAAAPRARRHRARARAARGARRARAPRATRRISPPPTPTGNACVLTSSLGLGTGDFLPGLDLQLNSMLGEVDLVLEPLEAGERMQSMMAPSLALDGDGLALAIGSAGGTRLRTALVGVAAGILDEGLEPIAAVGRPRFHRAGDVVNAEPGVDEQALAELEAEGLQRAALAGAAPLLRRRQPDGASRRCRRSAAKRSRRHDPLSRRRDRQPADVAAVRAARVRRERAAAASAWRTPSPHVEAADGFGASQPWRSARSAKSCTIVNALRPRRASGSSGQQQLLDPPARDPACRRGRARPGRRRSTSCPRRPRRS